MISIGNLITLLVVVVILIIYRQLDKNNRSLEKVKRYADKVKADLDTFVDGKTVELKNFVVELDVHQKTGKEILKRITTAEESLKAKAQDIDQMYKRISQYDKALADLVSMTSHVEENLKRLQQESEFVDTVGKRIKESALRIEQIEKQIPQIKEEFGKQNAKDLKILSGEILKHTKTLVQSIEEEVHASEGRVNSFKEYLNGLESRRDDLERQTMANIQNVFDGYIRNAEAEGEKIKSRLEIAMEGVLSRTQEEGNAIAAKIEEKENELKDELKTTEELIVEKLIDFKDRANAVEQEYQQNLRDIAERGRQLEDEVFVKLKEHIEGRARDIGKEMTNTLDATKRGFDEARKELSTIFGDTRSEVAVFRTEVKKMLDDGTSDYKNRYAQFVRQYEEFERTIKGRLASLETAINTTESEYTERLSSVEKDGKSLADVVTKRLQETLQEFENGINGRFSEVEEKLSEYEGDVAYRFTKLEEVAGDISTLEKNLKLSMERTTAGIEQDFTAFEKQLEARRNEERQKAEESLASLHRAMDDIDKGLQELKARAYDNVSAKLQVFEDDFFKDLTQRTSGMQERFEEWKAEIEKRIDEMGTEYKTVREQVEKTYNDELQQKLQDIQGKTFKQYAKFDDQVTGFQDTINERINLSVTSLKSFEESVKKDVEDAKLASRAFFEKEFKDHTTEVSNQMKKHERDIDSNLKVLSDAIEEKRKELLSVVELAQSDVTVWQTKVLQQMKETEGELSDQMLSLKKESADSIESIRSDFEVQKNDLILATQDERDRLKKELKDISEGVVALEADLRKKTESAMEDFGRMYDDFMQESLRKSREMQAEVDQKLKEFKTGVQDIREKADSLQKKLYGKIEENYNTLSVNLQEIDKKVKNFIAQTKIFDRADTLKLSLQENIEDLKAEIVRVDALTKETKETEKKFLTLKKTSDDVQAKLNRFFAEKRRIDEMEADFKKLISISQAIDVKLSQINTSNDTLQAIQARIRALEEIEKDVSQKFDRLEKKNSILESTTEGVDRNFQLLTELEDGLKKMSETFAPIPDQLDKALDKISIIQKSKKQVDLAVKQIESMDSLLKEIEDRTAKMQKAREWLARTETRLEEISNQAQEQVKLLGSIMKEGAKAGKEDKGAPSMGARDVVIRLAHQGWSVQEIARTTKLSRGEVELILELLPKG